MLTWYLVFFFEGLSVEYPPSSSFKLWLHLGCFFVPVRLAHTSYVGRVTSFLVIDNPESGDTLAVNLECSFMTPYVTMRLKKWDSLGRSCGSSKRGFVYLLDRRFSESGDFDF